MTTYADLQAERFADPAWWVTPVSALDLNDPRHGSHAGAVAHWKAGEKPCKPCADAARRLSKATRLDAHRGNPRTVPLGDKAWSVIKRTPRDQLSRVTGMTVAKLIHYEQRGPDGLVFRSTRDRIIAAGEREYWTPIGIQRRLWALTYAGWSMRALAAETGCDYDALKRLRLRTNPKFIRRDFAEAVIAAYEHLSMTHPTGRGAARARTEAARHNWPPALAWDDIDNPRERPKGIPETGEDDAA